MNKRIKELADQAGFNVEKLMEPCIGGWPREDILVLESFARLIVQECSKVAEDDITDGDACCTNTADRISRQIKKHFGVEE